MLALLISELGGQHAETVLELLDLMLRLHVQPLLA